MNNQFITQAVDIVAQAITADNAGEYEKALPLYRRGLEYFMTGLKYEKNPSAKERVMEKVQEYMKRAEFLKDALHDSDGNPKPPGATGGGSSTASKSKDDKDDKEDGETKKMRGALSSAILSEKPNVKWSDVAGLEGAKEALKEAVVLPIRFPQLFTGKRKPWKGILLYGPPGTGKSYLAKAVATEADSTFFAMSSSDLVSKWQGESEKLVKQMFEMAREAKPSIIFIDEIDSLCTSRAEGESESSRRIKTEFLVQMDGVGSAQGGILVLGATNVPWEIDQAMRRRFEKRVYIALPEAFARTYMFKLNLGDTPHDITPDQFDELGHRSGGFSGSDVSVVVREALMEPIRKCQVAKQFYETVDLNFMPCTDYPNGPRCPMVLSNTPPENKTARCQYCNAIRMTLYDIATEKLVVPVICFADFEKALARTHGSVGANELEEFVKWTSEFGQEGV
jgi:vacuolar protein-sorting-associated protein 4